MKALKTLVISAAFGVAASAQAASVDTFASVSLLDWEVSGDVSFYLDDYYNYFDTFAIANDYFPQFYADDFNSDYYDAYSTVSYTVGDAFGSADANANPASSTASAFAENAGSSTASSYSELAYEANGTGEVTLTFGYSLYAAISEAWTGDEYAFASIFVDDTLSLGDSASFDLELFGFDGNDALGENYEFQITLAINGLQQGALVLESFALADTALQPVPVPAAGWLFITAMAGLFGAARRKNH